MESTTVYEGKHGKSFDGPRLEICRRVDIEVQPFNVRYLNGIAVVIQRMLQEYGFVFKAIRRG